MAMPPQLARPRPKRSESRPTVELLPAININDLRGAIPKNCSAWAGFFLRVRLGGLQHERANQGTSRQGSSAKALSTD